MTARFFTKLSDIEDRIPPARSYNKFLLDKNEQADDIDIEVKKKVLEGLLNVNWNRYPVSDYRDIESKIADYCGLKPEQIVLSAGSASIITTLLDYFALNKRHIVIAQPSYSLFDYHCKTYNIPYDTWMLNEDLEFDFQRLPALGSDSVLILTSPNNPVGNTISKLQLEHILNTNGDSLIILDAVYCEFSEMDFTPLINSFENLIILRSFSKAFPIAGLRLGYLCAAEKTAAVIKKLILQFSITHFSLYFAHELLFNSEFIANAKSKVRNIISEREMLYHEINKQLDKSLVHVYKSEGNFLLIRIHKEELFEKLMTEFRERGIKILNTSNFPMLRNTFRVSIGNKLENAIFLECLVSNISKYEQSQVNQSIFHDLGSQGAFLENSL